MTPEKQKLKLLRKLLGVRKRWTKHVFARTKTNRECNPQSRNAVCWCLAGGCEKLGIGQRYKHFEPVLELNQGIISFNDDDKTKHEDILKAIDLAIRNCTT